MVNNHGIIIHKLEYKKGKRHDYDIYREDYSVTPKEVVNVFDVGYLGVEKDLPEQISSLPFREKRNLRVITRRKRTQQKSLHKENGSETHHL